jgi:RES domain
MPHGRHGRWFVTATAPARRIRFSAATRIIASRYPPIDLYERVSPDPAVWDALIAAEMLVNPRIRDQVGDLHLVPPDQRMSGIGATFVMAAFTHIKPSGSRFSDGSYGVYYAAHDRATAVAETAFHFGQIARDAADGPRREAMRVLVSRIDSNFHDIGQVNAETSKLLLDPDSYTVSQAFAAALRSQGSNGVHYPSVRRAGGRCIGAFRPKVVGIPRQTSHLVYEWDGVRVRRYFDRSSDRWIPIDSQD